jgi:hypothetical protein
MPNEEKVTAKEDKKSIEKVPLAADALPKHNSNKNDFVLKMDPEAEKKAYVKLLNVREINCLKLMDFLLKK